jgi:hypothetical protein
LKTLREVNENLAIWYKKLDIAHERQDKEEIKKEIEKLNKLADDMIASII